MHKALAWQLKAKESKQTMNAIEKPSNDIPYNPTEINAVFKKCYIDLCTSQSSWNLSKIDLIPSSINLPCLPDEERGTYLTLNH